MQSQPNITNDASGKSLIAQNAATLSAEITWFVQTVQGRLQHYFQPINTGTEKMQADAEIYQPPTPPDLINDHSVYADFVKYYQLGTDERLLLMLALVPQVQPHLLDMFFSANQSNTRGHTEFGGIKGSRHSGFIPTIETAYFLLAANDLEHRFRLHYLFAPDHFFSAHNILQIEQQQGFEPATSNVIGISEEYVDYFTTGILRKPRFSMDFPAKQLTTSLSWDDLILDEFTTQQLGDILIWLQHGNGLLNDWGMDKKIKPGYKALFHGPPGTGKTMTAALLGKQYNLDVYRIDLSMVVSKYIGETEKNLEKVFKKAETKNWILFFDEADSLFGKRTNISDAHDKYANQEIAYLLQRLETYPGLVILASNMRNNVDEAFTRRLQSIVFFPSPQEKERFKIWQNAFSENCVLPPNAVLERVAKQYDLSGGSIINVVQYASLMALHKNTNEITIDDILYGIRRELKKEGKTV